MWESLGKALALMMIIEGIIPFLDPRRLRLNLLAIAKLDDRKIRLIGFLSMILGVILLNLLGGH